MIGSFRNDTMNRQSVKLHNFVSGSLWPRLKTIDQRSLPPKLGQWTAWPRFTTFACFLQLITETLGAQPRATHLSLSIRLVTTRIRSAQYTRVLPPWLWELKWHGCSNSAWVYDLNQLELPFPSNVPGGATGNNGMLQLAWYRWLYACLNWWKQMRNAFSGLTFAITI